MEEGSWMVRDERWWSTATSCGMNGIWWVWREEGLGIGIEMGRAVGLLILGHGRTWRMGEGELYELMVDQVIVCRESR